jgi:hypothetical protein
VRATSVEPAIEFARYVPGALDQQPERNVAAKQPVHARDVGAQVAADQDCASAIGEGRAEAFVAADVKSAQDGFGGLLVKRVVAREEARRICR